MRRLMTTRTMDANNERGSSTTAVKPCHIQLLWHHHQEDISTISNWWCLISLCHRLFPVSVGTATPCHISVQAQTLCIVADLRGAQGLSNIRWQWSWRPLFFCLRNGSLLTSDITAKQTPQISIHWPSCFNGCVVKFCVFPSRPRWKVASFLLAGGGQLQLRCFGGAHGSCSVPCQA